MGVCLVQAKGFGGGFFFSALQKGVVVQHLVDFLRQLQRGQLQQADRLLQLGRERQVLGHAKRQTGLHACAFMLRAFDLFITS